MAKDTSMSKCPEMESGCNRRISSIRSDRFRTNDGFMFKISVVHGGKELSNVQLYAISHACCSLIRKLFERDFLDETDQMQLTFDF